MAKPIHFKNTLPQNFPFRQSLMKYILQNIKTLHLRKLIKTCKFFFNEYQISSFEDLTITNFDEGDEDSDMLFDCMDIKHFIEAPNYFLLIGRLEIWDIRLSDIFHKIVGCFLKEVFLSEFDALSLVEFGILMESKSITTLYLTNREEPSVVGIDGNPLPLEDILEAVPKAADIKIKPCFVTSQTLPKLLLNRNQKFMSLTLNNINGEFDSKLFFEFMKKYATPQASIKLKFCDGEFGDRFRMDIEEFLKTWETEIAKPKFRCDGVFNNVM
uniref:F-box domain-containing protein n=1 Tax=Panagrolaimus sp. PS1159 TaxID=55785 RepID=A0AC35GNT8_9BILA